MTQKSYEDWTLKLRAATLISLVSGIIWLGMKLGNWQQWRKDIDESIVEMKAWQTRHESFSNMRETQQNSVKGK